VMDKEMGRVLKAAEETDTDIIITSDHGNIEEVLNPRTGQIETGHDPNPVPFYLFGKEFKGKKFPASGGSQGTLGLLSDVAPTVLALMGIKKPDDMTGENLLRDLI